MKTQGPSDSQSDALQESEIGLRRSASRERKGSARPTYLRSDGVGSRRSIGAGRPRGSSLPTNLRGRQTVFAAASPSLLVPVEKETIVETGRYISTELVLQIGRAHV